MKEKELKRIAVRCTSYEKEEIMNNAKLNNMSISLYVKQQAMNTLKPVFIPCSAEAVEATCHLATELSLLKKKHPNINIENAERRCHELCLLLS